MTSRIIVVDDDPMVRAMAAGILRTAEFQVTEAEDALDALDQLRARGSVDLLVTDLQMPRMNGIKLAIEVNRLYPQIKILLVSGEPVDGSIANLSILAKPFRSATLIGAARRALAEHSAILS